MSLTHLRVSGPVTGLKRMPSAMPAMSRVAFRPLCDFLPWSRSAAFRRSSTAALSFSRISSSVATRVASVTAPRGPDQLGVEILRRRERAHHVFAQLVVVHRTFDVGFDVLRRVVDLVPCLGHARWILSPRYLAPDTPGLPTQTDAPAGCAHPRRLRRVERAEGADPGREGARVHLPGARRLEGRAVGPRGRRRTRLRARAGLDVPARPAPTRPRCSAAWPTSSASG